MKTAAEAYSDDLITRSAQNDQAIFEFVMNLVDTEKVDVQRTLGDHGIDWASTSGD